MEKPVLCHCSICDFTILTVANRKSDTHSFQRSADFPIVTRQTLTHILSHEKLSSKYTTIKTSSMLVFFHSPKTCRCSELKTLNSLYMCACGCLCVLTLTGCTWPVQAVPCLWHPLHAGLVPSTLPHATMILRNTSLDQIKMDEWIDGFVQFSEWITYH